MRAEAEAYSDAEAQVFSHYKTLNILKFQENEAPIPWRRWTYSSCRGRQEGVQGLSILAQA